MIAQSRDKAVQAEAVFAESLHYSLIIEWDPRDNIYVVTMPELPGCRTHGATYAEAIRMAQEAIEVWVTGALQDGWERPAARHFADDE
jgi:predicted RNase H-like HicB family nuclease